MARRHEIDWLRVLLFGLLVPHHAAVSFSDFGADVYGMANDPLAGPGLTLAIYWSHCWRLPALFVVAGIGTWLATERAAGAGALGRRMARLLVPALFGTLVLNGLTWWAVTALLGGGPAFGTEWRGWLPIPDARRVMHLWFLYNLALYTAVAWPVLAWRARLPAPAIGPRARLAAAGLAGVAVLAALKPHSTAVAGDGHQLAWYLVLFGAGLAIGARLDDVLGWARRWAWVLLGAGCVAFVAEVTLLGVGLSRSEALGVALAQGGWAAEGLAPAAAPLPLAFAIVEGTNAWVWCLAALGLASRYLRRPGPLLPALTRATYPVYVLHFPVVLIGTAWLVGTPWPWGAELVLLILATYALTAALWTLASRLGPAAYLVGGRAAPIAGTRSDGRATASRRP